MAASLTISSASLAADGKTVTVNIGGASGSLTPTSGVTGFRVRAGSNTLFQASATISGTVLTIVLASFVGSGQTVQIDTVAGNLADGSGNTMVLATNQAVTNSATKTASFFSITDAKIQPWVTGNPSFTNNFGRNQWAFSATDMRIIELLFTGTDLSFCGYMYGGGNFLVTVDGGAETTITTTGTSTVAATTWTEVLIAGGLTEGTHRVTIREVFNNSPFSFAIDRDNTFKIAGAAPAILAPTPGNTSIDPCGTVVPIKQTGGLTVVDNTAAIRPDPGSTLQGTAYWAGYTPPDVDFKATISTLKVLVRRSGKIYLEIDGTPYSQVVSPSPTDNAWAWITFTGLDATQEHTYRLTILGTASYSALQTIGGTGINLAWVWPAAKVTAFYGDSITFGFACTDIVHGHTHMIPTRLRINQQIKGIGGATVGNVGGLYDPMSSDTRITPLLATPNLDRIVILGGANDTIQYYNSGGTPNASWSPANYYTAYRLMLEKLSQSGTNNFKLDCWGILHGAADSVTPSFNQKIQDAVADFKATYPSKARLVRFIDTTNWHLGGLHPNDAESIRITDRALAWVSDSQPGQGMMAAA